MSDSSLEGLVRRLRSAAEREEIHAITDRMLVDRFLMQNDALAFEVLLARHGLLVWNCCRRSLRSTQDAEDAFQAVFVIFSRRLRSIRNIDCLASWLHRVSVRVANRLQQQRHRKQMLPLVNEQALIDDSHSSESISDLQILIDEEINRLPDPYREVFILCSMQGWTNEQAARLLGCATGTIDSRLGRARERLRKRLQNRGITLGSVSILVSHPFSELLARNTLQICLSIVNPGVVPVAISTTVTAISEGVLQTMFITKLKWMIGTVLAVSLFGLATFQTVRSFHTMQADEPKVQEKKEVAEKKEQPKEDDPDFGPLFRRPKLEILETDDEERKLLKERYNTLLEQLSYQKRLIQLGKHTLIVLFDTSEQLTEVGLEVFDQSKDRIQFLQDMIEYHQFLFELTSLKQEVGAIGNAEKAQAKSYWIHSKLQLLREKKKQKKN